MKYIENPIPAGSLDHIFCHSSEAMTELPDCSVHLMVTSPPYNVGKEYDEDLSLKDYLAFLRRVWKETKRVLVPGGRMCINVANLGRKPYIPLHAFIAEQADRPRFPDARRDHLEQGRQRLPLHGLGQLEIGGQPHPAGRARVHPGLLQRHLQAPEPRQTRKTPSAGMNSWNTTNPSGISRPNRRARSVIPPRSRSSCPGG